MVKKKILTLLCSGIILFALPLWAANPSTSTGDVWTIPIGIGVGKVVKLGPLPVKLALGVQYMLHHPNNFGQRWNIQLGVTPVITNLIKDTLFGE
jgi:hypothetical protein